MELHFFSGLNYIDFDNMINPLRKTFTALGFQAFLQKTTVTQQNMKLSINNFEGYDSHWNDLFSDYGKKLIQFLTIEEVSTIVNPLESDFILYEMRLELSSKKYLLERKSTTILGWLSDVGGLNDAIILTLSPFISYTSALSFSLAITNETPSILQTTKKRAIDQDPLQQMSQRQSSKLQKKLDRSEEYTLNQIDIANLLYPAR